MTTETDAEFVERIERRWMIAAPGEDIDRLFALARRGAAVEDLGQVAKLSEELDRLRAALRRWEQTGCPDCSGDCCAANIPISGCIMQETRAALEDK